MNVFRRHMFAITARFCKRENTRSQLRIQSSMLVSSATLQILPPHTLRLELGFRINLQPINNFATLADQTRARKEWGQIGASLPSHCEFCLSTKCSQRCEASLEFLYLEVLTPSVTIFFSIQHRSIHVEEAFTERGGRSGLTAITSMKCGGNPSETLSQR